MLIVRAARTGDISEIYQLAKSARGKLHSLPLNKKIITEKITHSCRSFQQQLTLNETAFYFFVMEDSISKKIVGCSAIQARVGEIEPYYLFCLIEQEQVSQALNYRKTRKLLELTTDLNGAAELCSLYLLPEYREKNNGKLLSFTRLLFITHFSERFPERIFADILGWHNKKGISPFWQAVTSPFLPLSFLQADQLMGAAKGQFITDLMPKFPLYIDLLPHAAQTVIGVAHPASQSAQKLLEQERFHHGDYINVLDGGPTMIAFKKDIKTVTDSFYVTVTDIVDIKHHAAVEYLLANNKADFRVVLAKIAIENAGCILTNTVALALQVTIGDKILCKNLGIG